MPEILLSFCICFSWRDSSPAAADVEAMIVCGGVVVVVVVVVVMVVVVFVCRAVKQSYVKERSGVVSGRQAQLSMNGKRGVGQSFGKASAGPCGESSSRRGT